MFVYEKGNSLNLTFKGSIPVENPEVVIKGFEDGATLTVNGTSYGAGTREFEGKAKTFVYQKDGKLMITFKGIAGMSNPDVTVDEIDNDVFAVVIGDESVTLSIVGDKVIPVTETTEYVEETTPVTEPVVEIQEELETPVVEDESEAE